MPIAIISAGAALMKLVSLVISPISQPRITGESVAPIEFSEQPNCTS